jgi:AraC-like DNA-binding protein
MTTLMRRPAAALAPFVEAFWYVEGDLPPGRERKLPSGEMQIVVNLAEDQLRWYGGAQLDERWTTHGAGLCGALAGPVGIDTAEQRRVLGVSFRPGGTVPFFAESAEALTEPVIGLDVLWGRTGSTLRELLLDQHTPEAMLRTMEAALLQRVVRPLRPDAVLVTATAALDRGRSIGGVVDALGMTRSTFARRFRHGIGLAPKPFARVRRLQRVLGTVSAGTAVDWAAVATRHGFFDQAHLINDFRALTGLTPSGYEPRSATEPNHVPG